MVNAPRSRGCGCPVMKGCDAACNAPMGSIGEGQHDASSKSEPRVEMGHAVMPKKNDNSQYGQIGEREVSRKTLNLSACR